MNVDVKIYMNDIYITTYDISLWCPLSPCNVPHKETWSRAFFNYNLGANFYGSSGFNTISKNLREKDWKAIPKTLELYRNPGSSVEAGLLRRRIAEGKLWMEGL